MGLDDAQADPDPFPASVIRQPNLSYTCGGATSQVLSCQVRQPDHGRLLIDEIAAPSIRDFTVSNACCTPGYAPIPAITSFNSVSPSIWNPLSFVT